MLGFLNLSHYMQRMSVRLRCDSPGCERCVEVPLLVGTHRIDLSETKWWVATDGFNSTVGCCESHLNEACRARKRRPAIVGDDELAYA
jgi:hypothetical protein